MIRVLLLSSFAGSSRYIASLLPCLKKSASVFLVAEGVGADVLSKDGIAVDCVIQSDAAAVCDVFNKFTPDVVFVVPQFSLSIEELAIQEAKKRNIYCIAAIDHWSLYKERFSKTDADGNVLGNGLEFIPNKILVNDDIAYQDSISAGIPEKYLSVVGNPVLEFRWQQDINGLSNQLKAVNIQSDKKNILFISEPYSERISVKNKHYPGFSEKEVLEDILWATPENSQLWIKPHPSESIEKFIPLISHNNHCDICIDQPIDNLLIGVDTIVGMGSMLLLEAALIRQSVISYRPCDKIEFIGNRLGLTYKVSNKEDLRHVLQHNSNHFHNKLLSHQYSGSAKNIMNCIVKFDSLAMKKY